jgi:hypothetical protein
MTDFLTDVEQCLHPNYKMPTGTKRLKEPKSKTSVTLVSKGRFLLYSFDLQLRGIDLFPFFSTKSKLRRVCDYILFCIRQSDGKPFVLIIELKTKMDPTAQLWATKHFVDFLIKRVNAACNSNYEPEIRKIGILEAMPKKIQQKYRSSGTRAGKILYDDDNTACILGKKFVIADYLIT